MCPPSPVRSLEIFELKEADMIAKRLFLSFVIGGALVDIAHAEITFSMARSDTSEFCLFANSAYSIGAVVCSTKKMALVCTKAEAKNDAALWKAVANAECETSK